MPGLRAGAAGPRRPDARLHGRVAGLPCGSTGRPRASRGASATACRCCASSSTPTARSTPGTRQVRVGAVGRGASDGPVHDPRARRARRAAARARARSASRRRARARPALARAAASERHADRPRTRRGGRAARSTPPASRRGRATCGRPGQPHHETVRGWLDRAAPRRALRRGRQPAAAGASSSACTRKPGQRERAERGDERDVDRVAAAPDDDAADARRVVARVEGVPATVEVGLEPGREVHRLGGRRRLDVRDVAEHVAGRDVQGAAERDREVGVVAADALAGPVGVGGRGPRVGRAGHPGQVAVDEVDDRLHPAPARREVRRSAARPRGRARRAGRSGWA